MGSAASSTATSLQAQGKTRDEIVSELQATNALSEEFVSKSPEELDVLYKTSLAPKAAPDCSPRVELDRGPKYDSVDAIVDAVAVRKVTGLLDLGSQREGSEGEPPGLLFAKGLDALTALPSNLLRCALVRSLCLKCNALESIEGLGVLTALEELDVSENRLVSLSAPDLAAIAPTLRSLDASENALETIPSEIGLCLALEQLILFKNRLKLSLPEELGTCGALVELNVFNNTLLKLPKALSDCCKLEIVNCGGNKIKTLPATDNWTALRELKMHQNGVCVVPSLEACVSLETIKFDMNKALAELPAFAQLANLTLWESSMCRITRLPEQLLSARALVTLNCSSNLLAELPALALPQLEILNVSSNELTALPAALVGCVSLKTLFFAGNHITAVPAEFAQFADLAITRVNASGQKTPGLVMDATLAKLKDACDARKGRFIF